MVRFCYWHDLRDWRFSIVMHFSGRDLSASQLHAFSFFLYRGEREMWHTFTLYPTAEYLAVFSPFFQRGQYLHLLVLTIFLCAIFRA